MKRLSSIFWFLLSAFGLGAQVPEMLLLSVNQATPSGGGTPASSLVTNLSGYWRLDEVSGNRADALGVLTLTDNNTVGSQAGIMTNASLFVSNNLEWLSVADSAATSTENLSFTVTGWFLIGISNVQAGIVNKHGTSNNREFYVQLGNSRVNFVIFTNNSSTITVAPSIRLYTNIWTFFACVADTTLGQATVWTKSAQTSEWTTNAMPAKTMDGSNADFQIGRAAAAIYSDLVIDEVGFWLRSLSTNELINLYNYTLSGTNYPWTGLP